MAIKGHKLTGKEYMGQEMDIYLDMDARYEWEFDVGQVTGVAYYGTRISDDTGRKIKALHIIFGEGGDTEVAWLAPRSPLSDKIAARLVNGAYQALVRAKVDSETYAAHVLEAKGWTILRGGSAGGKRRHAAGKRHHVTARPSSLGGLVADINRLTK